MWSSWEGDDTLFGCRSRQSRETFQMRSLRLFAALAASFALDQVMEQPENTRFMVLAPIVRGRKGEFKKELEKLHRDGYLRARIDGDMRQLDEEILLGIAAGETRTLKVSFPKNYASEKLAGQPAAPRRSSPHPGRRGRARRRRRGSGARAVHGGDAGEVRRGDVRVGHHDGHRRGPRHGPSGRGWFRCHRRRRGRC